MKHLRILGLTVLAILIVTLVAGCGGGGADMPSAPPTTYITDFTIEVHQPDYLALPEYHGMPMATPGTDTWFSLTGHLYEVEKASKGGIQEGDIAWSFFKKAITGDTWAAYVPTLLWTEDTGVKHWSFEAGEYLALAKVRIEGDWHGVKPLDFLCADGIG